jgi:F-type H+-transporting ATPase subunit epsilon
VPGDGGYFGVLPGHAPTLAAMKPGELWYRRGNEKFYAYVVRGFAEVLPDRVAILAQVAERAEDIDVQRAEAAKRRAEDRLARAATDMDAERARIALIRSLGRLNVSQRARRH